MNDQGFPPEEDDPIIHFMDLAHDPDTQTDIRANGRTWTDCDIIMVDPGVGQVLFENADCTALVRYDSIQVGPRNNSGKENIRIKGH